MSFNIRLAVEEDFEKIHALNKEFAQFIKTPEKFKITVEQMKEEMEFFKILIAESQDGDIVAFATTCIAWYSWSGKSMYLDDLFVVEKFRGNGLGSRLVDEVIEMARKENCTKVKWQVSKWNQHAIEFYKSKGAIIDDVEINCDLVF